ncbi:helix-turn-helix domain-containing protein [Nonomuraea sp. LPB2021202275-12-8]|uniref:helix-turn-helix domain-containing protein n=1 Tax=Nonomuraea sp. LPB2021202275-12-8 TaxID=3120159 RepID=UPI00300C5753
MKRISNIVRHRLLAGELRRLREESALTGPRVAEDLGWSTSKLSRLESALIKPSEPDVQSLIDYFHVPPDEQETYLHLARQAVQRNWWDQHAKSLPNEYIQFIGLEHEAKSILEWHLGIIPGLLQTEDYARTVNSAPQEFVGMSPRAVRLRTQVRLKRQELLFGPEPLELVAVIDQSVLLRSIGGRAIMHSQLEHLAKMSTLPNITIRILELDKPYALLGNASMTQIQFHSFASLEAGLTLPDVTYMEHLTGGSLIYEEAVTHQCGRMFQQLEHASLDPAESLRMIRDTAAKMALG